MNDKVEVSYLKVNTVPGITIPDLLFSAPNIQLQTAVICLLYKGLLMVSNETSFVAKQSIYY